MNNSYKQEDKKLRWVKIVGIAVVVQERVRVHFPRVASMVDGTLENYDNLSNLFRLLT